MLNKYETLTKDEKDIIFNNAEKNYNKLLESNTWEDVLDILWSQVEFLRYYSMDEETRRNLPQ